MKKKRWIVMMFLVCILTFSGCTEKNREEAELVTDQWAGEEIL